MQMLFIYNVFCFCFLKIIICKKGTAVHLRKFHSSKKKKKIDEKKKEKWKRMQEDKEEMITYVCLFFFNLVDCDGKNKETKIKNIYSCSSIYILRLFSRFCLIFFFFKISSFFFYFSSAPVRMFVGFSSDCVKIIGEEKLLWYDISKVIFNLPFFFFFQIV